MFLILPTVFVAVDDEHWTTKDVAVLLMTVPDGAVPGDDAEVSDSAENTACPAVTSKYNPAVDGSVTVYCFAEPTVLIGPTVPVVVSDPNVNVWLD